MLTQALSRLGIPRHVHACTHYKTSAGRPQAYKPSTHNLLRMKTSKQKHISNEQFKKLVSKKAYHQ